MRWGRKNWSVAEQTSTYNMSIFLLSMFLIPKDETQADDKIFVRQLANNLVEVEHYDSKMNKKYKICIQRSALKSYITNIVKLYLYDSDPFDNIQFNFTGFPSFMTNKNNLQENPNIISTLRNVTSILIESESIHELGCGCGCG